MRVTSEDEEEDIEGRSTGRATNVTRCEPARLVDVESQEINTSIEEPEGTTILVAAKAQSKLLNTSNEYSPELSVGLKM